MLAAHHRPNNPTGKRLGLPHSHFEKTQLTDSTIYNVQPLKNRRFSSPVAKDGLGRLSPVKAIGITAALRVAEIQSSREGVGPEGQPAHQIGGGFNDHQLPRWPREIESEPATAGAEARSRRDDNRIAECGYSA